MRVRLFVGGLAAGVVIFSVAEAGEIRYDTANRRDPFRPLVGPHALRKEGGKNSFAIEGIVFDQKKGSYAVIGGEIFREGDSINEAQLIKIFPDRVIVNQQSEEIVIWLREEIAEPGRKLKQHDLE